MALIVMILCQSRTCYRHPFNVFQSSVIDYECCYNGLD